MIEHARASILQIDRQIERVALELDSLNALRAAWERWLALRGELIEQPGQGARTVGSAGASSPAPVSAGAVRSGAAPAPAPAVAPLPHGSGSPAIQPAGRGRDGGEAHRRGGRPASSVAASLPHGSPPRVTCPECDAEVRPGGLGPHRRHRHGHRADKNPRSTPPLDLPPRIDQAVGE